MAWYERSGPDAAAVRKSVKDKEVDTKLLRYIYFSLCSLCQYVSPREYSFIIHYIIYILLQQQT